MQPKVVWDALGKFLVGSGRALGEFWEALYMKKLQPKVRNYKTGTNPSHGNLEVTENALASGRNYGLQETKTSDAKTL